MKKNLIILSLSPLFFLTFIQNFPFEKIGIIYKNIFNFEAWMNHKCLIIGLAICLIWTIISAVIYVKFKYFFTYGKDSGYTIYDIQEQKDAGLTFFLSYVLPLMKNNIDKFNNLIMFLCLTSILILLLSKTDLYYKNPILIIAGCRVYKFRFKDNKQVPDTVYVGISLNSADGDNTIEYKLIEDNVLVIRQMR